MFKLVLTVLVTGLALGPADELSGQNAQAVADSVAEPILQSCSTPEHRQFDFWLGNWQVADTSGVVVGSNKITQVANGCGLNEYWRGANGNNGTSLNWYEPANGKWHQLWVGLGLYLRLSGGLEDGKMVLSGERDTAQGKVIDRISWTPLADGSVRQVWEVSRDAGQTWQLVFNGHYTQR